MEIGSRSSFVVAEAPLSVLSSYEEGYHLTSLGRRFELRYREHCVQLLLEASDAHGEYFDEILQYLDTDSQCMTWIHPDVPATPHEILQHDENGKEFVVRKVAYKADAIRMIQKLETAPHKQIYWFRAAIG